MLTSYAPVPVKRTKSPSFAVMGRKTDGTLSTSNSMQVLPNSISHSLFLCVPSTSGLTEFEFSKCQQKILSLFNFDLDLEPESELESETESVLQAMLELVLSLKLSETSISLLSPSLPITCSCPKKRATRRWGDEICAIDVSNTAARAELSIVHPVRRLTRLPVK